MVLLTTLIQTAEERRYCDELASNGIRDFNDLLSKGADMSYLVMSTNVPHAVSTT